MGIEQLGIFILITTAIVVARADDIAVGNKHIVVTGAGPCTEGTKYIVGDDKGWQQGVDYNAWVQGKDFRVGDILVFDLTFNHCILVVDEDGINRCCGASRIVDVRELGRHEIVLTAPGKFGFMSHVGDDCMKGMKFLAIVKAK
ncbi:blue copper protein-like [Bidens hawaiensis]|uniref:blue copper protein-like n=1 Tax=Bidens hawaiensis TaxID=980011 RepID=UPI004048F006